VQQAAPLVTLAARKKNAAPATSGLEEVPCDYCGSEAADVLCRGFDRLHGLPGEFRVVVCRGCGLARTSPRPTAEGLALAYGSDYPPHAAPVASPHPPRGLLRWALVNGRGYPLGRPASPLVKAVLRPLACVALVGRDAAAYPPYVGDGRLLDFGCGSGGYVAKMAAAGWKARGLDASPEAVRAGRDAGLPLDVGTLPGTALPDESLDALTMWHSLEHVASPKATLAAACRALRPGGILLAAVPRLDSLEARWFGSAWIGLDLPRHLTHFTHVTLKRHVEAAGFRVMALVSRRSPGMIRRSFAYRASETGRWTHRRLARSRFLVGLVSYASLVARRTGQMICLAEKPAVAAGPYGVRRRQPPLWLPLALQVAGGRP
jgi:SAM-dependent methyltransferase